MVGEKGKFPVLAQVLGWGRPVGAGRGGWGGWEGHNTTHFLEHCRFSLGIVIYFLPL